VYSEHGGQEDAECLLLRIASEALMLMSSVFISISSAIQKRTLPPFTSTV